MQSVSLHGVGKHAWDVSVSEVPFILKVGRLGWRSYRHIPYTLQYGRYSSIILPPTMLSLKLSLLLLYLRIFSPDKVTRYLIYFGIGFVFVAYTILTFLNIFSDVQAVIDANKTLGVVNICSDFYILCVPIAAISKLQLSLKKKLGVMLVFMTGILYVVPWCQGRSGSPNIFTVLVR